MNLSYFANRNGGFLMGCLYSFAQKHRRLLAIIALFLVTMVVYAPVLRNEFVSWDDDVMVINNPDIKEFSVASISKLFTALGQFQYKPVTFLCFLMEYHFFQLHPVGYHAVSLALHLVNIFLVFWIVYLLGRNFFLAWTTAGLFALHPLGVECVAWVSAQKDLLCALFFFSSIFAYLRFLQGRGRWFYYLSLCAFIISLLSKPVALGFPLFLFCFDAVRGPGPKRPLFLEKVPFFAVSIVVVLFDYLSLAWLGTAGTSFLSWADFAWKPFFYLSKIIFPVRLCAFYPVGAHESVLIILSTALLLGSLFLFFLKSKQLRRLFFGFIFFIILLLATLPIRSGYAVADRYIYIAGLGIFYISAHLLSSVHDQVYLLAWHWLVAFFYVTFTSVFILLGFLTFHQVFIWHDSVRLWNDVLEKYPASGTAHLNLANAYLDDGNVEGALKMAEASLKLEPGMWDVYSTLGNIYLRQGLFDQAEINYRFSLRLNPNQFISYNNLASIYKRRKNPDYAKALSMCRRAILQDPRRFEPYLSMGDIYLLQNLTKEAIPCLRKALSIKPESIQALFLLYKALAGNSQYGEQLEVLQRLVVLDPDNPVVFRSACMTLTYLGEMDAAEVMIKRALKLAPSSVDVLGSAAYFYTVKKDYPKALNFIKQALALRPDDEELKGSMDKINVLGSGSDKSKIM